MAKLKILETGFLQIPNSVTLDKKLSLKAKGLFAYMQSKPDNWEFSAQRIAEELLEGEKAVLGALKELEKNKYLVRRKYKDEKGQWQWEHVLENPYPQNGGTEDPSACYRRVDNRSVDNRRIKKERINNKENISTNVDIVDVSKKEEETKEENSKEVAGLKLPFNSEAWLLSLAESPQAHIRLVAYYFTLYSEHNFPTKKVATDEMAKNLKPAVYLIQNYEKKDISKTLKYCKEKFSEVHWNLATVKKQISYVTSKDKTA